MMLITIVITSCKKKTVEPAPVEACKPKVSEIFVGKYVTIGTLVKDTIELSYVSTDCYSSDINLYTLKGLYKAVSDYSTNTLENRDYAVFSSEQSKNLKQNQYSITFGMYTWAGYTMLSFSCNAGSNINMTFQKVP